MPKRSASSKKKSKAKPSKKKAKSPRYNNYLETVFVAPSRIHGRGLFARGPLKRGDYIGTYEGPYARRTGTHVLWVEQDDGSELGISGRNSIRYANHSRKPNAEFEGFDLYATKRIKAEEEITIHYGDDWLDVG